METVEIPYHPGFTPRGLAYAIVLSIALHLLLAWYLSNWYKAGWDNPSPPSFQRPLHITISAPVTRETKARQAQSHNPAAEQKPVEKSPPQKQPIDEAEAEPSPKHSVESKPAITGAIKERTVTTAQIKRSATAIVNYMTEDDKGEQIDKPDSVSAILDRALNKPREKPGIYTRADGTTRVVTEQGFTYCMKAADDWRIIDPQDDLQVSAYCN
jgi:hypothetical protein